MLHALLGHVDAVTCVDLSLDDSRVVSGSRDGTIRVWNARSSLCVQVLEEHEASVNSVGFSHNGNLIVSAWVGIHQFFMPNNRLIFDF